MRKLTKALVILAAVAGPAWASESPEQLGNDIAQAVDKAARKAADTVINRHVQRAIWGDPMVKTDPIKVFTQDGHVELKGSVPNTDERDRALTLARKVAGVELVTDKMTVHKG